MGRHAEALTEHPGEMVFRQRAHRRQLAEADGIFNMVVDVLHQTPPLVRRQPALEAQAVAHADLVEQGVAEQFMGQVAGQQALVGSSQLRLINW